MTSLPFAQFLRFSCLTILLLANPGLTLANMSPVLFYSDLDSGPDSGGQNDKGAFVTVWGENFGTTPGTVTIGGGQADNYPVWSDTKIAFQLGPNAKTGDIVVTTAGNQSSNSLPFTVRAGRIFIVSPKKSIPRMRPGDILYFREGVYSEQYGATNWGSYNFTLGRSTGGAPDKPIAFVGYPSETAVLKAPGSSYGNFTLADSTETSASYVTIANLTLQGADFCIGGGGFWRKEKGGGAHIRIVGNRLSASYTGNTMTGLITVRNDHWRILGNEIMDTGTTPPIKNNHGIYVQTGASDTEIGWNYLHDLRMGHVIQVHTDISYLYQNIHIHDNVITAANPNDSRGINIGRALPGTNGAIYNNILYNLGQSFSAIVMYSGNWKVYNNTLYNIRSNPMLWISDKATADVKNNIFYSDGASDYIGVANGATMAQMTLSNNLYHGYRDKVTSASKDKIGIMADPLFQDPLTGNFRLQANSTAIDRGSDVVAPIVRRDRDGVPRPQGKHFDIGAFEAIAPQAPAR